MHACSKTVAAPARSDKEARFIQRQRHYAGTEGIPPTILNQEHGAFVVGALVEVKGALRADGSMDATRIEVQSGSSGSPGEGQSANFKGTIQSLPSGSGLIGDWSISDRVVHVTSSTRLKGEHGPFAIGARVKVKGLQLSDGSIVATRVQVRD